MFVATVSNKEQLLTDLTLMHLYLRPSEKGPIVAKLKLWDGRKVVISYYDYDNPRKLPFTDGGTGVDRTLKETDIETDVDELLSKGTPFATDTGTSDDVLCLQYEISE